MSEANVVGAGALAADDQGRTTVLVFGLNNVSISIPRKNASARVRTNGGGNSGYICAMGTAMGGSLGGKAVAVTAKLYADTDPDSSIPQTSEGLNDLSYATLGSAPDDYSWQITRIDNVTCSATGACPGHKLAAWGKFDDGTWARDLSTFGGCCVQDQTDCDNPTAPYMCPVNAVADAGPAGAAGECKPCAGKS